MASISKKPKTLAPVHPNSGLTALYARKLRALVDEMHRSYTYWLTAKYRANEPLIAQDDAATPASTIAAAMRELGARWRRRFDDAAKELAEYFATAVQLRSDATLRSILKKAGISVSFRITPAARDILKATINANVSLIKSIPQQYLTNVEGIVMRSVQTGRDLGQLTKELQEQYGVAKRRAAFIARDQNNKATAAITRARQVEIGITEAIWVHSSGGKEPRPTHLKAGRERTRYDIAKGWYDPAVGKHILPGELPNCRCVAKSVIPGFS